jgi:hypothetical protein
LPPRGYDLERRPVVWLGVVAGVQTFDSGECREGDTVPQYEVEYIDNLGLLALTTKPEDGLELYKDDIPGELVFLGYLAGHHRGTRRIKKDALELIRQGREYCLLGKRTLADVELAFEE